MLRPSPTLARKDFGLDPPLRAGDGAAAVGRRSCGRPAPTARNMGSRWPNVPRSRSVRKRLTTRLWGQWPPRTRNGQRTCAARTSGVLEAGATPALVRGAEHLSGRVIQEGRPRRNGPSGAGFAPGVVIGIGALNWGYITCSGFDRSRHGRSSRNRASARPTDALLDRP